MSRKKYACAFTGLVPALLAYVLPAAQAQSARVPGADTYGLARDAYLFAYPIVSMDTTMRQATNVPDANTTPLRAPVNQFAHARAYPNADQKDVVRFNFDTLYSLAWIDAAREPIVLTVPDTKGRYYLLEMLDMWTDVFSVVGSRTTGTRAGYYALVAPGWTGTLPQGVEKIVAPTPTFWIIGRTQTNGPADYANVHNVQDGYRLTPLGHWGKDYTPAQNFAIDAAIDGGTPPAVQVNRLNGIAMLTRLSVLLRKYPPHANENPTLFRLRALGLEPGKAFDPSSLSQDEMQPGLRRAGKVVNGWNLLTENVGTYGTSYRQRALVAYGGLGANLPEDAIYPTAFVDAVGKPLSGANNYVLHFNKGRLPPADAFWSITMYDQDGFQVANRPRGWNTWLTFAISPEAKAPARPVRMRN